jgi:hypothetical protein
LWGSPNSMTDLSGWCLDVADIAVDIVRFLLHVGPGGGLHVGVLVLDRLQVVLGRAQPVVVAIGDRQVSLEALLKHAEIDAPVVHLVYLEGGRGHCWTEGMVGHGSTWRWTCPGCWSSRTA